MALAFSALFALLGLLQSNDDGIAGEISKLHRKRALMSKCISVCVHPEHCRNRGNTNME
jgi:hypothetical protein